MNRDRVHFLFLNVGHFMDHLLMLVFATVAALTLTREWGMSYAELVPYAMPGFVAFGVLSLPAGWLADRWSRQGMMAVFFVGIGLAAIATSLARTPLEMATGLLGIGVFAAIYHPVGLAMVVQGHTRVGMAIAINGIWGNLGVAAAALITGFFIDNGGWHAAFIAPGAVSVAIGLTYAWLFRQDILAPRAPSTPAGAATGPGGAHAVPPASATPTRSAAASAMRETMLRLTMVILFITAASSIVFQATTFALPKVFDERLGGIATSATLLGWLTFLVFAIASSTQLIVGNLLDRYGPRPVFLVVASIQVVFFLTMPGLADWSALAVAFAFMVGTFGQVPIVDFVIGKLAKSEMRASVFGARYVVAFAALALALPLIAWVHQNWGFDVLFRIMAASAAAVFLAASLLPARLPDPEATPGGVATAVART